MQQEKQDFSHMSPEESKAALGISTRLYEDMLKQQAPQQEGMGGEEMSTETEPQEQAPDAMQMAEELDARTDAKLEDLKKELQESMKSEISSLKEMIKEALNEQEE